MNRIPKQLKISSFLVFYLVHSLQIGVGILGFQRILAKTAGNDAWIAVLAGGVIVHGIIWMLYKILEKEGGDISDVHQTLFGKYIGSFFTFLLVAYFCLTAVTVLRTYIEVVQVWVFPGIRVAMLASVFLVVVYYIVGGGLRAVAGIAFFGVVLPSYLLLALFFPLKYAFFENLLPIFNHSISEIFIATRDLTLSILGFEAILFYYPFIDNPQHSKKWAHLGAAVTTVMYLAIMLVSIFYFAEEQLSRSIWATLTILKIVQLPFVERIEYIAISSWLFVILPNVCLSLWASSRGIKRIFQKNQRQVMLLLCFVVTLFCSQLKTRQQIEILNDLTSKVGFYLITVYVPVMFVISMVYYRMKGRAKHEKSSM